MRRRVAGDADLSRRAERVAATGSNAESAGVVADTALRGLGDGTAAPRLALDDGPDSVTAPGAFLARLGHRNLLGRIWRRPRHHVSHERIAARGRAFPGAAAGSLDCRHSKHRAGAG